MDRKESITKTANLMRGLLWFFVALVILCALGIPTIFHLDIQPMKNSAWLEMIYILLDSLAPMENSLHNNIEMIETFALFSTLLCLLISFSMLVWNTDRLFHQYAQGNIFTDTCIKHFFMIGWSLIALFVFNTLGDNFVEQLFARLDQSMLYELSITDINAIDVISDTEGFFLFFISLDFSLLLAGVFTVAVTRVMQMGVLLQKDIDATV